MPSRLARDIMSVQEAQHVAILDDMALDLVYEVFTESSAPYGFKRIIKLGKGGAPSLDRLRLAAEDVRENVDLFRKELRRIFNDYLDDKVRVNPEIRQWLLEAWISTAYGPYTRIRPNDRGSVDLVTATTLARGKLERIVGVEDVCLNLKGDGNVERLGFDEDFLDYSHRDIPKATVGPIRLVKFGCKSCANTKWLARPSNPGVFFPDGADVQWLVLKRTIPEGEKLWWAWGDGEYEKECPCPPAEKRKSRGGSIASFVVPDWEPPTLSPTQAEPDEKKPKKRIRTYSGSKRTIKKPRRASTDHRVSSPSAPRSSSTESLSPPPPVRRRLPSETPEPSPIPDQSSESPWVETPAADEEVGADIVTEQTQVDVDGVENQQDESYDTTLQPVADDDKAEEEGVDRSSNASSHSRQSSVSDLTTVLQTASSPMSMAKVSPKTAHNENRQVKPAPIRMTTEPTFVPEPSSAGAVSSELTPVAQLAPAVLLAPTADAVLAPAFDGRIEQPINVQSVVHNLVQNVVPGTVPAQLLSAGHTSEETTILNLRLVVSSDTLRNAAPATDPALEERIAALQAELEDQKSMNEALQSENASLRDSVQQHNAVVSQHQADMSDMQSENASLQVQKDALEHDKAKFLKDIEAFKKQIAKSTQDNKKLEKDAKQAQGNYKEAQQDIKTIRREKDEVEKRCQILAEEIEKLCRDKEKLSEDLRGFVMRRKMAAAGPEERVPREYPAPPPPGEYPPHPHQHPHPPPPMEYPYPPPGYPSPPPHAGSPWSPPAPPQWGPSSAGPSPAPHMPPHYPPRPATASGAFPHGPYPDRPPSGHGHGPPPMHSPDVRMRHDRDRDRLPPPPHPLDVKPSLPSLPSVLSGRPGGGPPPPPPHIARSVSGMTSPNGKFWN